MLLIDHYAVHIGKKISLVSIKKFFHHCHASYSRRVSSYRVLYLQFLGSYDICITYLHAIEGCLKVTIAKFYFLPFEKSFKYYENIFQFHLYMILKRTFLASNYEKQMFRGK